jgi:hypothetical protein
MLVLYDDAKHDMACRRASRHETRRFHPRVRRGDGWIVISTKNDWKRIFRV